MPSPETLPLFELARSKGIGFYLGYAERTEEERQDRTASTPRSWSGRTAAPIGKYRKVHLPGHAEHRPDGALPASREEVLRGRRSRLQRLEDVQGRRHRRPVHLQRPALARDVPRHGAEGRRDGGAGLQHADRQRLCAARSRRTCACSTTISRIQAAAYQNGIWVVATAKAGKEDGFWLHGGSAIVAPTGEIVAKSNDRGGRGHLLRLRHGARRIHPQHHLQFRQAPPARALQADHRARPA